MVTVVLVHTHTSTIWRPLPRINSTRLFFINLPPPILMDLGGPRWIFGPGAVKLGQCKHYSATSLVSSQPLVRCMRQVPRWRFGVSSIAVANNEMSLATIHACTWQSISAVNLCLLRITYQQSNTRFFFSVSCHGQQMLWRWCGIWSKAKTRLFGRGCCWLKNKAWFTSLIWVELCDTLLDD